MRRSQRGFTLIEVMIASSIAIAVIMGALVTGIALQRRAVFEEQAMGAQEAARATKDLLTAGLIRAGVGLGSARINLGGGGGVSVDRYAVSVTTDAAFAADGTFALPAAPYDALVSDSIDVFSGDPATMVALQDCGGGPFRVYQGNDLCAVSDASALANRRLLVVNPRLGVACYQAASFIHGAGNSRIKSFEGPANNPPPNTELCEQSANGFWDQQGAIAMASSGASFRINWASGAPILELDVDGVDDPTTGFIPVSQEVERIKVRLGVATLNNPAAPLVWFGQGGLQPIDTCPDSPGACDAHVATVGGFTVNDLPAGDVRRARDALMRRVRLMELVITTRSIRRDNEMAQPSGATFVTDGEGMLLDGYRRRTFSVGIAPRNLKVAGLQ